MNNNRENKRSTLKLSINVNQLRFIHQSIELHKYFYELMDFIRFFLFSLSVFSS